MLLVVLAAGITRLILQRVTPGKDYRTLRLRLQSWRIMILFFFAIALLNRTGLIFLFGCISLLALKEFFSIVPLRQSDRRARVLA